MNARPLPVSIILAGSLVLPGVSRARAPWANYLYDASFDNGGTKTSEKKQHDVRITGGIRIPILGM